MRFAHRTLVCLTVAVLAIAIPLLHAQSPPPPLTGAPPIAQQATPAAKDIVAVLEFEAVGATQPEVSAVTDRLEDALLKDGAFALVDRTQKKKILSEQAFQQAVCSTDECQTAAGRMLGANKIITGRLTKIDETTWELSAQLLDVKTGETLKTATIPHKGDYFSLLRVTTVAVAAKLSGVAGPSPAVPPSSAPPPPPPAPAPDTSADQSTEPSIAGPVMTGVGFGLGLFFTAMAQAFKSSDSSGDKSTSGTNDPGYQILTTFSYISYAVGIVGVIVWIHERNEKPATADLDSSGWYVAPIAGVQTTNPLAMQVGYRLAW